MANYKNQNLITDIKVDKIKHIAGTDEAFMQPFSWDKMSKILFLLSGNEYKLYMYLLKWSGKTTYEFSPADIADKLNFKEDTARKAFKNFVQYGILIQIANHHYKFDPYPDTIENLYNAKYLAEKVV